MRFVLPLSLLFTLACGDDSTAGCPDGFDLVGGNCIPASDAGSDAAIEDAGEPDQGCSPQEFFRDEDGDGFGDPEVSTSGCAPGAGYVDNSMDCNDMAASAAPGMSEVCDALDNDCDFRVDEGLLEVGEETRLGFGSGDVDLRIEAYPVGYVVALTEFSERKVVSVGPAGGLSLAEWVLGTGDDETVDLHILEDNRRAIVIEQNADFVVHIRVVALDGTTVSDPVLLPLASGGSDIRIVEASGRVFASFVTGGSDPFVRHIVELDGVSGSPLGDVRNVYDFVDPGPFTTGFAPLVPNAAGDGFIAMVVDRAAGDLIAQPYFLPITVEPEILAESPVAADPDRLAGIVSIVPNDEGDAFGLYTATDELLVRIGFDSALTETSRRVLLFSGEPRLLVHPRGRSQEWLFATDFETFDLYIPNSPLADGQQLALPFELEDLAQRTPNDGAYVYKNDDNQYIFRRITCTPE